VKTWFSAVFALYGYSLVVWYYWRIFSPVPEGTRHFLWVCCITCASITRLGGPPWRGILLVIAPANALIYAFLGFFVGKIIQKLKSW